MADTPFKTVDRDGANVSLPTAQLVADAVAALQGALVPLLDNVEALLAGTPLPTGAATETKLEAVRALLAGTLAVSAAALPLPTGAATQATLEAMRVLLAGTVATDTVVRATAVSRSGTITAGGAAQQLMAANASRRGFVLQNNSSALLYVNGLGAATADGLSLTIQPGELFETAIHHVGTGAVSILGPTTGQTFYVREF